METKKEAIQAIRALAQENSIKMHQAFPDQFAPNINVRMALISPFNGERYNESKKPTSPKIATAEEIHGFELERKIMCTFDGDAPVYPSEWLRGWVPATDEEYDIWNDYAEAIAEAVKLIKKKRPNFELKGENLYVLHEPIKARVIFAGDSHTTDISVEAVKQGMVIKGLVDVASGFCFNAGLELPKAPGEWEQVLPIGWRKEGNKKMEAYKASEENILKAVAIVRRHHSGFWSSDNSWKAHKVFAAK